MKKQELNLTDEEKLYFLKNLKLKNSSIFFNNLKLGKKYLKFIGIPVTVAFTTIMHLLFLNPITTLTSFLIPSFAFGCLYFVFHNSQNAELLTASNGKINYKQYKQLEKSGELAKWQEQFKEELKFVRPLELTNLTNDICRQTRNTTYTKETNTQPSLKHSENNNTSKQTDNLYR